MTLPENELGWLPPIISLDDFGGDWNRYLEVIYASFCRDFVSSRPTVSGLPVALKSLPPIEGKHGTFWHLISEGRQELERTPDFRRCERIAWPRALMEAPAERRVRRWVVSRGSEKRTLLSLPDFSYVVVLGERKGYFVLWTAYCVESEHRRMTFRREAGG